MCFCSYRASLRDIAEAKAIALTSNAHFGKIYNLNGPELLSGPKVASIWSTLLGKEIRLIRLGMRWNALDPGLFAGVTDPHPLARLRDLVQDFSVVSDRGHWC